MTESRAPAPLTAREREIILRWLTGKRTRASQIERDVMQAKLGAPTLLAALRSLRAAYPDWSTVQIADAAGCARETVSRLIGKKR